MPSLQTNVWGPPQWLLYHLLPLSYPIKPTPEDRVAYATKILADFKTLPCNLCRDNVPKNLTKLGIGSPSELPTIEDLANSPYLLSPDTLAYFFFQLHNEINSMLGKPVIPLDKYWDTQAKYKLAYAKSSACAPAANSEHVETGCTIPEDGYMPCMSRVALVPRSLGTDFHGPAFYFDASLTK